MLALKHIHHKRPKNKHELLDHLIYFVAFAGPIMTLPQVYDVWIVKQQSVNEITWASYLLIGFVWLYYGIIHKVKPIIYSNILGIFITGLVVAGSIFI